MTDVGGIVDQIHMNTANYHQGDQHRSLWELVEDFNDGSLVVPDHQRGAAWSEEKKCEWVKRVIDPRPLIGCILTYVITDSRGDRRYLNDGLQRLTATAELKQTPETFGLTPEQARDRLRQQMITVQHRAYPSHEAALLDFQAINLGTPLTPRELFHGVLTNMPNWKSVWEPRFARLHALFDNARASATTQGVVARDVTAFRRKAESMQKRHHMALWLRLMDPDVHRRSYGGRTKELPTASEMTKCLESRLRRRLEPTPLSEVDASIQRLGQIVDNTVALCEAAAARASTSPGRRINWTAFYGLLEVAVWKTRTEIPEQRWRDFVDALYVYLKDNGYDLRVKDQENRQFYPLTLRLINYVDEVSRIVGCPLVEHRRTRAKRQAVKTGFDVSHVEPFATHGDGATVIEPSGVNRARRDKPMTPADSRGLGE